MVDNKTIHYIPPLPPKREKKIIDDNIVRYVVEKELP